MALDLEAVFAAHNDEYLKFDRVRNKLSKRPDMHAFRMLDGLVPSTSDLISAAEHDEIWLDVDLVHLANVANEYDIRDLIRCGVRYDSDTDSLCMFV